MIRRGVIHRVVLITTDADQAAFGNGLFLVGFTGRVFDMGVKHTTSELNAELTLAPSREQSIDIQTKTAFSLESAGQDQPPHQTYASSRTKVNCDPPPIAK